MMSIKRSGFQKSSFQDIQKCYLPFYRCSTVGAIIMTPLLTKLLAGQLVPVDAAVSCGLPIFFGMKGMFKITFHLKII